MAYTTVTSIFGPSVGPILGGALSQYEGWHWYVEIFGRHASDLFHTDLDQDILVPPDSCRCYFHPICALSPGDMPPRR